MLSYIVDHSCFHLNVQPVRLNAYLFAALIPPDTELMTFFKKARPVNCPRLRTHVVHSLLHKLRWRMTILFWLTCTVYVNTRWFWHTMTFSFHLLFVSTNRTKAEKAKPVKKPVRLCSFSLSFKCCIGFYYYGAPPPATTFRQRLPPLRLRVSQKWKRSAFFYLYLLKLRLPLFTSLMFYWWCLAL